MNSVAVTARASAKASDPAVPVISVLMPVFNAKRYVARAVGSILGQTFGDFEFIILDDGSTDGSLAILDRLAAKDRRIRLISRPNRGLVASLNEMLELATGSYIARMDADDISDPVRFERQLHAFRQDESLVAIGSDVHFIDPAGRRLMTFSYPHSHEEIDAWMMAVKQGGSMSHPAMMIRASALKQVGPYRENFQHAEDADLILRLSEHGNLLNLSEPLICYRLHPASIGHLYPKQQRQAHYRAAAEAAQRRALPAPGAELKELDGVVETAAGRYVKWAWWALGSGNLKAARALALSALIRAPLSKGCWLVLACAIRGH